MRWSRVVCGWGACLALSWGPARAEDPDLLPPLQPTLGSLTEGAREDGASSGEGAAEGPESDRLAQAPPVPGPTAPPAAIPPAPGAAPTPPAPPSPATPPTPAPSAAPTAPAPAAAGMLDEAAQLGQASSLAGFGAPEMFGDRGPGTVLIRQVPPVPPPPPTPRPPVGPPVPPTPMIRQRGVMLVPSVRGFKVSDNQSPLPQDRFIYSFNYFEELNKSINRRQLAPIENVRVYRHFLGLEKTLLDGRASIGFRLPINTLTTDSRVAGLGGTSTSAGDLNVIAKYTLLQDRQRGYLISTGLSITAPTGPAAFAGTRSIESFHNTTLQPFLGYLFTRDRFYAQGFLAIDVPTNPNDVTILYNDLGVGYFAYRSSDPARLVSAVAPTFEVHVNTPLNHRGFDLRDPAGTPDFVNLTLGTSISFRKRARLLLGVAAPVTGPRPFDFEALALLNVYF